MGKLSKLTALAVQRLNKKGRYADGGGLYLQVSSSGTKSWLFRYMLDGRSHEMGLGPLDLVPLAEARERSYSCRKLLLDGKDPMAVRESERQARRLETAKTMTFRECAIAYIDAHAGEWRNDKHISQWRNTLETYAHPIVGDLSVQSIDQDLVLKVLQPIWTTRTETASRLRGRIESILDWASVRKLRQGDNPARWRGHLDKLLPRPSKIAPHKHHPALPIDDTSDFIRKIQKMETVGARALEFLILTVVRTGGILGARWDEINWKDAIWTVPGERMKGGQIHRVPLTARMMEILHEMNASKRGELIFPGRKKGKPLSNMALVEIMRGLKRSEVPHGFRSTFKDWAAERTNFPNEVTEMALAHTISNKVEAAYRRGDLFLKRRKLMEAWTQFCQTVPQEAPVVKLENLRA